MTGQQQYSLRWNDYTSYITGAFDALRYEEDLVDVTLFCEGRKIRAHKVLLSACSTYFKEIFKENPSQHPVIIFKNVKFSDLMSLVEFMYQGEVSVLQESLPSFLHTAEMLSIRGLADTNNEQQQQQQHHLPDQPTSTLAQQILQTQSQNMATSATITTSEPVYFTLPSNSTIVPQTKLEPQPSTATALQTAQQFVNKITLKSSDIANAVAVPIGQQQAQQQHQQQQLAKIQVKPAPAVATAVPQRTVAVGQTQGQDQTNQTNQAATLQELVDSVVTSAGPKKPKRIIKAKTLTVKQPVAGTSSGSVSSNTRASYSEITSETGNQSDNGMDLYSEQSGQEHDQVTTYTDSTNNDVKIQISEYINVGEGLNPTSGDSGSYTQQEGYELVGDAIAERQEGDEHMGQNCFEMEIVDVDVNGMFPDDGAEDAKVKTETMDESAGRSRDDGKKFQCKECDKAFATWKSLAMHRHIHSGRTKCKICGAVLSRTANLKRHMKLKHEP